MQLTKQTQLTSRWFKQTLRKHTKGAFKLNQQATKRGDFQTTVDGNNKNCTTPRTKFIERKDLALYPDRKIDDVIQLTHLPQSHSQKNFESNGGCGRQGGRRGDMKEEHTLGAKIKAHAGNYDWRF